MNADKIRSFLRRVPPAKLRAAVEELVRADPVFWAFHYRRLRGEPLVFDNMHDLTAEALAAARKSAKNLVSYQQELKSRLTKHRPFLVQPLRDESPHKVFMKGRQVGVSELMILEAVYFLVKHDGRKVFTTFPRDGQLRKFVTTRIDPAFAETPRMKALLQGANAVYTKQVGKSFWVLGSAWESNLGEGVDADVIVLDEKDRMAVGVETAFIESLKSSKFGWLRELSTPTLPNRGVALSYNASDRKKWLVRCASGHEQEIVYPDNVVQVKDFKVGTKELAPGTYEYLCRLEKCRKPLDRLRGRWVAERPSIETISGYHISQLLAPWIDATALMKSKIDAPFPQHWINYDLGLPSLGEKSLLNEVDYELACAGHELLDFRTSDWRNVTAGIDWGNYNWIWVTAENVHNGKLYCIGLACFEDDHDDPLTGSAMAAEQYLVPFAPEVICADDGFGKDRNAYLRKRFEDTGTQFFACRYSPAPKNSRQFQPVWNEDGSQVLVDRNMWLKVFCRRIKMRELGLPNYEFSELTATMKAHIKSLVPYREMDEDTKEIVESVLSNGPDHFAHAGLYSILGQEWLQHGAQFGFTMLG